MRAALPHLVSVLVACSAPATLPELKTAEARADQGDVDGALAAYRQAQTKCGDLRPERRARAACGEALLGEAEVLERAGRPDAIDTYLAIPSKVRDDDDVTAAVAVYRAGELLLKAGKTAEAWTALWRVVTEWPDEPSAADALKTLLVDGRGRDARALGEQIANLTSTLASTQVADNLLWSLADITEHELANPEGARALYDRIPLDYPQSGLRDDARWHAARISRAMKDPQGAVTRLRALVATREVAFGAGSYFSIWLDDAQLELGRVLRDELSDMPGAMAAFRKLPKDYPASILKDDALYELAITQEKANDHAGACESLKKLAKQAPDSKYLTRGDVVCP
ncbi:MAG: tetratricopeptide repeat protein [Myxococcota bacterium]|nr:tetratricopeptide repeat protein [Deltaproteobacteria bacterium]MDQ3336012.1 tetratricopeptide repeat protein [Myxococcota bacterium]